MKSLKAALRPGLLRAVARVVPRTWRWRRSGSLVTLMYHRVLPPDSPARAAEQPAMYVSPQTLDMHLSELKQYFEIVGLEDWLRRARDGAPLPHLACAITFDDGWRDNLEFGLPVLRRHSAPATIFLVSGHIGSAQQFWPTRLSSLLRTAFRQPRSVVFPPTLRPLVEPVLAEAEKRGELLTTDIDRVIEGAKRLDEALIRDLVGEAASRCAHPDDSRGVLDEEEIAQLAGTGLVRFGSHTATHYRLGGNVPPAILEREIVLSRARLQDICGQTIEVFCYPNGEMSPKAVDCVRHHYLGAVTTQKGWHDASADPHLIRRIGLHERMSHCREYFLARLSAWV
jgi:peptidoglycan/xylan/chitin deacetylase (PgdA/CDA1 family)